MLDSDTRKIIWIFGRPSAGKTTLGDNLAGVLQAQGYNTSHLDGDILRRTVSHSLGFGLEDRHQASMNAVREVNRQLSMFRVIVVTMVTPLERSRRAIKKLLGDSVIFVYCYCTVDVCASRDQRGLYEHGAENIEYFETPRIEHFMVDMRSCDERSAVLNVAEHLFLEGF